MGLEVKNKRMKISPNGVITLPVAARKALGMKEKEAAAATVKVVDGKVVLSGKYLKKDKTYRISKSGMMVLKSDAKDVLEKGLRRHYMLDLDDKGKQATLIPC